MELPQIVGLDVTTGLRHANGNMHLFARLLRSFASDFAGFATKVESSLQAGNQEDALRQAHTLKGLAATLGAHEIRALATALEQCLHEKDLVLTRQQLTDTGVALEALLSEVRVFFVDSDAMASESGPIATVASPAQSPPSTPLEQWLPRLKELLASGDTDARTLWDAQKPGIGNQMPKSVVERISAAIEGFDFDGALGELPPKRDP